MFYATVAIYNLLISTKFGTVRAVRAVRKIDFVMDTRLGHQLSRGMPLIKLLARACSLAFVTHQRRIGVSHSITSPAKRGRLRRHYRKRAAD